MLRGKIIVDPDKAEENHGKCGTTTFEKSFMFFAGISILCAVPVFNTLTHLPPFMGILFGLGILWLASWFTAIKKSKIRSAWRLCQPFKRSICRRCCFSSGFCLQWLRLNIPTSWLPFPNGSTRWWTTRRSSFPFSGCSALSWITCRLLPLRLLALIGYISGAVVYVLLH